MPLIKRLSLVAAKVEATAGTPVVLAAADVFANVYNAEIVPDIPMNERLLAGTMEQAAAVPGSQSCKISFDVEIAGKGSTGLPAWATVLLPACGLLAASQVYTVTSNSANWSWLTIGVFRNGKFDVGYGCQGTVTFTLEAGKQGMAHFEFQGVYEEGADTAIPTGIAWPVVVGPKVNGMTLTLGGTALSPLSKFTLALGQNVIMRKDGGNSNGTGYISALMTNKKTVGTIDPETVLAATDDRVAAWIAGTEQALSVAVGTVANNIITFAGPKAQKTKINWADRDGVWIDNLDYQLNADMTGENTLPFDNSFSVTFS